MRKVGGQGGPHDHLEEQQQIRDRQQVRDDAQKKKKRTDIAWHKPRHDIYGPDGKSHSSPIIKAMREAIRRGT